MGFKGSLAIKCIYLICHLVLPQWYAHLCTCCHLSLKCLFFPPVEVFSNSPFTSLPTCVALILCTSVYLSTWKGEFLEISSCVFFVLVFTVSSVPSTTLARNSRCQIDVTKLGRIASIFFSLPVLPFMASLEESITLQQCWVIRSCAFMYRCCTGCLQGHPGHLYWKTIF